MSNYSNGRMEVETAAIGDYRVLSHDRDDQGDFTEVVSECYRLDNARLAAAAPELLEIAKGLLALEHQCKTHGLWTLAVKARAAIAKATGA